MLSADFPMALFNTLKFLAFTILPLAIFGFNTHIEIAYRPRKLMALNGHWRLDPATYDHCRSSGILRRPRYLHRSSIRRYVLHQSSLSAIPSIWSSSRAMKQLARSHNRHRSLVNINMTDSTAAVTPILKKTNLDPADLSNYRPISNLPFVSKIMEKAVASQLK
ncbi:uncharacterized protein LOC119917962 [Tachysurus ichikawai]